MKTGLHKRYRFLDPIVANYVIQIKALLGESEPCGLVRGCCGVYIRNYRLGDLVCYFSATLLFSIKSINARNDYNHGSY